MNFLVRVRYGCLRAVFVLRLVLVITTVDSEDSPCVCLQKFQDKLLSPVRIAQMNDGSKDFLIAEQRGIVSRYNSDKKQEQSTFLDLATVAVSSSDHMEERGLLDIVLHPKYAENRKTYVYYIREINSKDYVVVSEIEIFGNSTLPHGEQIMLAVEQKTKKRNGGQMLFGNDGYLYISVGDGGVVPDGRDELAVEAQSKGSLLGKILRIDVDNRVVKQDKIQYYGIPPDNPYIGHSEWREEIFALGFRNPWRCGMDKDESGSERLFCGDTGTDMWEEINIVTKGGNYGWNLKEGFECLQSGDCAVIDNEVLPAYVYNNSGSAAVVGGNVYRGTSIPSLKDQYLFGDAMNGNLNRLQKTSGANWTAAALPICPKSTCPCEARASPGNHLLSFGEDNDGEMYVLMTQSFAPDDDSGTAMKLTAPESKAMTCGADTITQRTEIRMLSVWLLSILLKLII